ncbi:inositol 1,4,5-triphosphate kinase 2 isoform X3 [Lasioglossum baleicum]|uniref:inositol 1,4,5-triphosphate kinase 2 isoform X3 n=1 Tax=Lasioglossum baleicum TaxID=434251 RepID=UPI003FCE5326
MDSSARRDPIEKRVNFSKIVQITYDEEAGDPVGDKCATIEKKRVRKVDEAGFDRERNRSKSPRARSSKPVRRGRWESSRDRGRRDEEGSYAVLRRRQQSKQLSRAVQQQGPESEERELIRGAEEASWKRNNVSSSTAGGQRKRRVGIVENQYVAECEGGSSVCELVHGFERLFGDRTEAGEEAGHAMRSKNQPVREQQQQNQETTVVDPVEANETYDEFDTVRMPVVRSLSKSPQSDEGIEADPERRRGSVARCWSLDSAAASDEDLASLTTTHQLKRHKLRVTRCCSSDSAVLSDEDQIKGWDSTNAVEGSEAEHNEGRPRYWRTPSVVVSDYSDYSYLDEKLERNDLELEKYEGTSGTPSQASSCSCLDCDEIRESLDNQFLGVCRSRRHSDSCCLCLDSMNATAQRNYNESGNRRNSCLDSTNSYYSKLDSQLLQYTQENTQELQEKSKIEFLDIPPSRKISDCSTTSSLSGDESDVTDQPQQKPRSSGWRKLRNIVHWTPFFQTYKKQRYPWVQLTGHQGNFRAGPTPGTILKKLCPQEEACFRLLMNDVLKPYVPDFQGVLDMKETEEGSVDEPETGEAGQKDGVNKRTVLCSYLQLQDLLGDFEHPCVMDCKVGVRTYLESELAKAKERPKLRKDMYEKMVQVDPTAPSAEERRVQGVTKPRYMVWRETISSTATLGFRVEGIKLAHGGSSKDFKTTRTREQVTEALRRFVEGYPHAVAKYILRLQAIKATLKASPFFASHEVVGSSLLFVHDAKNAGIWMIDFAKTLPLPQHLPRIRHDAEWQVGNHEDGYLIGVNNLIDIFQDIRNTEQT